MYAKTFDNQQIETMRHLCAEAHHVVLLSHMNADGDACGSILGMAHQLLQLSSNAFSVTPILPNGCPSNFSWMPGSEIVLSGEEQLDLCLNCIAEADLIICVDFNAPSRIDFLQQSLVDAKGYKILIDHHHSPSEHFDLVFSDPDISSTCELVVWLTRALWGEKYFNTDVACCLYTGLRTDTGGFAFSCSQPSCFEAAAFLVGYDIVPAEIHNRIVNTFSFKRMRFYGFALSQRLQIFPEQRVAIFAFSLQDLNQYGISSEDLEGLVGYTLMMKEIEVGALLREESTRVKVSFRSKYGVDVNHIANQMGGGGHTKASGATLVMPFVDAFARVKEALGVEGIEPIVNFDC